MNIRELKIELDKYPDDMEVVTEYSDWMGTTYCKVVDIYNVDMVPSDYDYRPKHFGDKTFVEAILIS